jgi:hypothetical protein
MSSFTFQMYCGLHFQFRESPCILYRITSFSYLKLFKKSAIQEHLKIIIILEQDRPALYYFKHEITWPTFPELTLPKFQIYLPKFEH